MHDRDIDDLTAALHAGLGGGTYDEVIWGDRGAELLVRCAQATVERCAGGLAVTVPVACDEEPALELRVLIVPPAKTVGGEQVVAAHTVTPGPVAARWGPVLERVAAAALFAERQPAADRRFAGAAGAPVVGRDRA